MAVPENPVSPLITLASSYGDAQMRSWCHALFALDAQLAAIIRKAREPMLAQIRLQWWHDVIAQPPATRPSANPVLAALLPLEAAGLDLPAALGPVIRGWEAALDLHAPGAIDSFADGRGRLIQAFHGLAPEADGALLARLGRCWALWDKARCHPIETSPAPLIEAVRPDADGLAGLQLPRRMRPLSIIGRAVHLDITRGEPDRPWARPGLFAALVWHGLTGR